MEALSRTLQPYKGLIGQAASLISMGHFLSGAFICKKIYKAGTTEGTPSTPFIGGSVIGLVMLRMGLLLGDWAMIQTNVISLLLNVVYIGFFCFYSSNKYKDIIKPIGIGSLVVAFFYGYAALEDPEKLQSRYGFMMSIMMLTLIGSPLLNLKKIVKNKDASEIPFPLVSMGTAMTFLWLLYSIILLNYFMIFQNVIGFSLCFVQLILFVLYPGKEATIKKKEERMM